MSISKSLPEFDEMVRMAQEDPEALEQLRQEMCEDVITSAPQEYQRKLRGLQFKIDMERRRAKTPMASCIRLSQMMHESFSQLREALNHMQGNSTESLRKMVEDPNLQEAQASIKTSTNERKNISALDADIIEFPAT